LSTFYSQTIEKENTKKIIDMVFGKLVAKCWI